MNNHTKGPWKYSPNLSDDNHYAIEMKEDKGCILIEKHIDGLDDEDLPNTILISTAPEMFEMLKRCSLSIKDMGGSNSLTDDIDYLIKKAQGR